MQRTSQRIVWAAALLVILSTPVLAQHNEDDHGTHYDPTTGPLVLPANDDFAPPADDTVVDGAKALPNVGISTFVEISEDQKAGLLTPFYRFTRSFAVKARIPLIFDRTFHYFGHDASGRGLGDVTLDGEYSKPLAPGSVVRLQISAKLPTGDEENQDDDGYAVPLGTGTLDLFARAQYAKSTPDMGFLAALLYRKNAGSETISEFGGVTQTTTATSGNQTVASVFARKRAGQSFWVHLGASAVLVADGKVESTFSDGRTDSSYDLLQAGTLVDLFPGISYAMGKLNPYLGVRIPVMTEYDNEFAATTRDMSFIFQFTYSPTKLAGN